MNPGGNSEGILEEILEGILEAILERILEGTLEALLERILEGTLERILEGILEGILEEILERIPEGILEGIQEAILEGNVDGTTPGLAGSGFLPAACWAGLNGKTGASENPGAPHLGGQDRPPQLSPGTCGQQKGHT